MDQAQIKLYPVTIARLAQLPVQKLQIVQAGTRPGQRPGLLQHLCPAEQVRQAAEGGTVRLGGVGPQEVIEHGVVLALNEQPHPLLLLLGHVHAAGQVLIKAHVAHLDVESVEATGPQGIHRQGDHLQVRFHPRGTQHLHATLGNLAAATLVGIPRAEHGLIVVQPLGQRQGLQLGSRQPCNGGGGVRAHDHDLA